jgi:uncharacterized membrane protein
MTDATTSPPPIPPIAPPEPAGGFVHRREMALVIYILYLVPVGITHIVGLVLAYVERDTAPDWLRSHYTFQIRTFWIGLLYFVVSCVLIIILIGIPMLVAVWVWFIIRCALGLSRLLRDEPYPTPLSWTV